MTASMAEIAIQCVDCPRCGALAGETCATALRRAAVAAADGVAVRDLADLEHAGPPMLHAERFRDAAELVRSAEAYGLVVRRQPGGGT